MMTQFSYAYTGPRELKGHIHGLVQDYGVSNEHLFCIYQYR